MKAQADADKQWFHDMSATAANHAEFLEYLRDYVYSVRRDITAITKQIKDNDDYVKDTIDQSDVKLKADLKHLSDVVGEQGRDTMKLRDEAAAALRRVSDMVGGYTGDAQRPVPGLRLKRRRSSLPWQVCSRNWTRSPRHVRMLRSKLPTRRARQFRALRPAWTR